MTDDLLPHLETFLEAAELGSFTGAARKLGLTQAAISHGFGGQGAGRAKELANANTKRNPVDSRGPDGTRRAEELTNTGS